MTGEQKKQTTE